MKSIEIDDEVFALIKSRAEPLVDDANSVLRRLLGVDTGGPTLDQSAPPEAAQPGTSGRAPQGSLLSEHAYEKPILLELLERGGRGASRDVTEAVGVRVAGQLTERDSEMLTSGEIRWRARVHFTRLRMKERGLIKTGSPRGVWELTEKGRKAALVATGP